VLLQKRQINILLTSPLIINLLSALCCSYIYKSPPIQSKWPLTHLEPAAPPDSGTKATPSARSRTSTAVSTPPPSWPRPVTNNANSLASAADTYIVYPKDNKSPEKAIIILSDIFGIYVNAQLLADEFAENGYLAVLPDLFRGDAIKLSDMESGRANLPEWLPKHQTPVVDPIVEATIKYVRGDLGVKRVAGVGYCFGGKVASIHTKPTALLLVN
jgi:hypothetical protein